MIKFLLYIFLILVIFTPKIVSANEENKSCDNRYLALVNPVRGRDLWIDREVDPLKSQYKLIKQHNFSATWLLQYDVLVDEELLKEIKMFDENQEKGVFLEISQKLADSARVIYPHSVPWYSPEAVFLSAYTQSERRRFIDKLFLQFKMEFGYFPRSVGAWWIDSYSLNYMKENYGIKAALIVADQKTTDNYGVWGQWWGVPYYPSKANILTPASSLDNKENVVIIQWAQRDPQLAIGEGSSYSNYSLQANDYISQGKDTKYFGDLVNIYLNCKNQIGQITIGLETGIESVSYINEYENQLQFLSTIHNLNAVTMSQFADRFSKIFPQFPEESFIDYGWILRSDSRNNSNLNDYIKYQQNIAFKDYFVADHDSFLNRNLAKLSKNEQSYFPYFLFIILVFGIVSFYKKLLSVWFIGTLFVVFSFGLILRSNYSLGWQIFYGAKIPFLIYAQTLLVLFSYLMIWLFSQLNFIKKNSLIFWFIPLSFGFDYIIQVLRFSFISGRYYVGFALDNLKFVGFSFANLLTVEIVNKDFPSFLAAGLLKFDFARIWDNLYLSFLIYPFVHIILAVVSGYILIRLPGKVRKILIGIFIILTVFQLLNIFQADPRLVQ